MLLLVELFETSARYTTLLMEQQDLHLAVYKATPITPEHGSLQTQMYLHFRWRIVNVCP